MKGRHLDGSRDVMLDVSRFVEFAVNRHAKVEGKTVLKGNNQK